MGQAGVKAFLTRLATDAQLSAGTQNQALAMLLFFTATHCVSIGITCPTKSLVFTILSRDITVHNRELGTQRQKRKNRAVRGFFVIGER